MTNNVNIRFDVNPPEALKHLGRFFSSETFLKSLELAFERMAGYVAGQVVKTKLSGQRLNRRTGILANSIVGMTVIRNRLPALTIGVFKGPALAYAGVQEFGTVGAGGTLPTIRPKNGKALAIPVGGNVLTPAGVSRFISPRDYIGPGTLRFAPSATAIGVLYDDVSDVDEEGNLTGIQYVLAAKVDIPPKHYLYDTMIQNLPKIAAVVAKQIEVEFQRFVLRGY